MSGTKKNILDSLLMIVLILVGGVAEIAVLAYSETIAEFIFGMAIIFLVACLFGLAARRLYLRNNR